MHTMAEITTAKPLLPDGLVAIVKEDCPTCVLVAPVPVSYTHLTLPTILLV